jgi:hypothetical protein
MHFYHGHVFQVYLRGCLPYFIYDIFEVEAKTYGWIFAFMSLSFILASQLNSVLLDGLQVSK